MGHIDHDEEAYTNARLRELIADEDLEPKSKERGIAQIVIDKGYHALSPKQKYVYDNDIAPLIYEDDEETLEEGFQRNMLNPRA